MRWHYWGWRWESPSPSKRKGAEGGEGGRERLASGALPLTLWRCARCAQYEDLLGCIDRMSMEELVMAVRRQSQGFSRGTSSFRGVTHHPSGEAAWGDFSTAEIYTAFAHCPQRCS